MSSCKTFRHSTKAMAFFSRASLNPTIALDIAVVFQVSDLFLGASSYGGRGERISTWIGHGAQPSRTHFGCFGWSGSAHSPLRTELPTDPPLVFVNLHPLKPPLSHLSLPTSPPVRPGLPSAPTLTSKVYVPISLRSSSAARAIYVVPTAYSSWLLLTVAAVFSPSKSADAIGRSGSRLRRDGRSPLVETATTRPSTKACQLMLTAL